MRRFVVVARRLAWLKVLIEVGREEAVVVVK